MNATTITIRAELAAGNARKQGYIQELIRLEQILTAMYYDASENFHFQRDTDNNYQDPTTDYLLGKYDAVKDLALHVRKIMGERDRA